MNEYPTSSSLIRVRRLHELAGHSDTVHCACFSPDGAKVASGSGDETVRVWDVRTGRQLYCLEHEESVWSVAFHPHRPLILSGDWDGGVHVWSTLDGKRQAVYRPHDTFVGSLSMALDGRRILTGAGDGVTKFWDLANGTEFSRIDHQPYGRLVTSRLPGSRYAFCVLEDMGSVEVPEGDDWYPYEFYRIEVCDLESGQMLRQWDHIRRSIMRREDLPPNPWAFLGMSDMEAEQIELSAADVSSDGEFAALGYGSGSVYIWDFRRRMVVRRFNEETDGYVFGVKFLHGKQLVLISTSAVSSGLQRTSIWDVRDEVLLYREPTLVKPLAIAHDCQFYVEAWHGGKMSLWQMLKSAP